MTSEKKDFFISYNKADHDWAVWIDYQLKQAGYTTVIQAVDFRPGSNFVLGMHKAIQDSSRLIMVLSPNFLTSDFTQPEWAAYFTEDPIGEKGLLLPVRVRDCEPTGLLKAIVYIDLLGQNEIAAKNKLLEGVRPYVSSGGSPVFPPNQQASAEQEPRFPGTLPPIWNVPHLRNPHFTGRESLLESLHTSLTSGQTAAVTQAIAGLGGVGKTQLATEYAYRHASEYDVVWWVRSEETATLASDYASLATQLGLPEKDQTDQSVIVEAVRRWLEHNTGWLLVLDNAVSAEQVRNYIPRGTTGHLLITSRNQVWRTTATPLSIKVFERNESVEFLLGRTGSDDKASADALAEGLGDLPLALEQAAAYIEATGIGLSEYMKLFEEHRERLLEEYEPSTDYPDTVATTWSISIQNVENESPKAVDLMRLLSFFASDDIPRSIIIEGEENLPESLKALSKDSLAFNHALAALRRYSLLETSEDSISVHRLVQAVVRDSMESEGMKEYATAAVNTAFQAFAFEISNTDSWARSKDYTSHSIAASGHSQNLNVAQETNWQLLNNLGLYCMEVTAEYSEAQTYFENASNIICQISGSNESDFASILSNLGTTLRQQGSLEQARSILEQSLQIEENVANPNNTKIATRLSILSLINNELGNFKTALEQINRALKLDESEYGPNDIRVATRLNNLGLVLQGLSRHEEALKVYERALGINEELYQDDHPDIATRHSNIADALRELGRVEEAIYHDRKALEIDVKFYGLDHPNVVIRLNNLGVTLFQLRQYDKALSSLIRAKEIDTRFFGSHHQKVARRITNIGDILFMMGDVEEARKHQQQAFEIFQNCFGSDHFETIKVAEKLEKLGKE